MNLQQLMKIDFNPRNKHRLLALGYATAVTFAFILSLMRLFPALTNSTTL